MKITIKTLEISFIIVYLLLAVLCITMLGFVYFIGSLAGFNIGMFDWFLIKMFAYRSIKKGHFSFIENAFRYVIVGISIFLLFYLGFNPIGILIGLSTIPVSITIIATINYFTKEI